MEFSPTTCYENMKRMWRRRRYQKLNVDNKKKMRVVRLGGSSGARSSPTRRTTSNTLRVRVIRKLRVIKYVRVPMKLLAKLHGAYVDMMVRTAGSVGGGRRIAGGSKKVAKGEDRIAVVAASEEAVDTRLVLEIYKRLAASRQLADAY